MRRRCVIGLLFLGVLLGDVYVTQRNIFNGAFRETFESCVMVLNNGDWIEFTTRDGDKIAANVSVVEILLTEYGATLGDVVIIMHNHFASPNFSEADIKTIRYLRGQGYTGSFGIYVTSTGKVYLYKDKK